MRKTAVKLLTLLTVCAMVFGLAACGTSAPSATPIAQGTAAGSETSSPVADTTPITFTFYVGDYWNSNYIDPAWTDPVVTELTKRTGVTLDVSIPASDDDEGEMNKLIASGELADLIFRGWGASKEALAKGGYVKPLDDLIEQYGPNVKKNMSGSFAAWRNRSDGKIYNIGYWYFNKVVRPALNLQVNTLQMRYDILKEMGYAKLDRSKEGGMNSFITLQEYYALLDQVKVKYPEMTSVLINPVGALDILIRGTGKQVHDGIWENNMATDYVMCSDAPWAMKEVNGLYRNGYAKIDDTTTTDEARKAMMADGKVFSCLGYANLISDIQGTLSQGSPNNEKRFVFFYLTRDASVQNIYRNGAWGDAASGTHINAKLDDAKTKRAMQFIDYCCSDPGSLLICAGIEGVDYFKDESTGWYKPEEKLFAAYRVWDANVFKPRGVGGWLNILPNIAGVNAEGHCFEVNAEYAFSQDPWVIYNNADWKHFAYNMIISPYTSFDSDTQADAVDADSKISAYKNDRLTNIMLAKDASTIDGDLQKLREQMKSDGNDALAKARTDNWVKVAGQKGVAPEKINQTPAQLGQ